MKVLSIKAFVIIALLAMVACSNNGGKNTQNEKVATTQEATYSQVMPIKLKVNQYLFEPNVVTVCGKLVTAMYYGAPNYGKCPEIDEKEYSYILVLDSTIDVINNVATNKEGEGYMTELGVKKVQLIFGDNIPLRQMKNKKVKLTGVFMNAETGHHHTAVLFDVKEVL